MSSDKPDWEIISLLRQIGLNVREAKVYVILLTGGEKKANEISKLTEVPLPHVYSILKTMHSKNIVEITQGEIKRYRAIPLELAIDRLIDQKEKALIALKNRSHEIAEKIQVNEKEVIVGELKPVLGKKNIEKKLIEMIQGAKKEILGITSASMLFNHIEYLPLLKNKGITAKALIKFDAEKNEKFKPFILAETNIKFLTQSNISRKLIVDDTALLIDASIEETAYDFGIWTNHREIVKASRERFEKLWQNAASFEDVLKKK